MVGHLEGPPISDEEFLWRRKRSIRFDQLFRFGFPLVLLFQFSFCAFVVRHLLTARRLFFKRFHSAFTDYGSDIIAICFITVLFHSFVSLNCIF